MAEWQTETTESTPSLQVSPVTKAAVHGMMWMLRRNLLAPMGNQLMVITTVGRKTGKHRSTPIGVLEDGEVLVATTRASGASNWFRNMRKQSLVTLEYRGRKFQARGQVVTDPAERQRLFELYRRERRDNFDRYFGVSADAAPEALAQALATRAFVQFYPEKV
ncbi:MAG: nitroreductase family deazaflavin-dependent oxidoreductase [Anaerolineae bacterium]